MLRNQLGRRNLNDYQRNVIALRYEEVIAEQMKKRMSEMGKVGASITNNGVRPNEPTLKESTTKRKELSKIAGTSEGSIQRTKLILEKGSEEQKERAMKGEPISKIAKEIREADKTQVEEEKEEPFDINKVTAKEIREAFGVNN